MSLLEICILSLPFRFVARPFGSVDSEYRADHDILGAERLDDILFATVLAVGELVVILIDVALAVHVGGPALDRLQVLGAIVGRRGRSRVLAVGELTGRLTEPADEDGAEWWDAGDDYDDPCFDTSRGDEWCEAVWIGQRQSYVRSMSLVIRCTHKWYPRFSMWQSYMSSQHHKWQLCTRWSSARSSRG